MSNSNLTSTARSDGGLPDMVFASHGGRTFHSNRLCPWLWKGLDAAAGRRGDAASEIHLISLPEAAFMWHLTLCQACFPDPHIVSHFGLLAQNSGRVAGMKSRDLADLRRLGLSDLEIFAWWDLGFVPSQVDDLLRAGVTLDVAQRARAGGESQNEIHNRLRLR